MQKTKKMDFFSKKEKKRHRGGSRERKAKLVGDTSEECWTVLVNIYTLYYRKNSIKYFH